MLVERWFPQGLPPPSPSPEDGEGIGFGLLVGLEATQRAAPNRGGAQLLLDAKEAVVLGDALGPGQRAGLDLARPHADRQIRDEGVLRLARPVRDDGRPAVAVSHLDRVDR